MTLKWYKLIKNCTKSISKRVIPRNRTQQYPTILAKTNNKQTKQQTILINGKSLYCDCENKTVVKDDCMIKITRCAKKVSSKKRLNRELSLFFGWGKSGE